LGGLLGILLGISAGYGIATLLEFVFVTPWGAIIAAFVTTFLCDHFGIVSRPQSIATGSDRSIALRIVDYLLQKTKSVT
jgi:hypothetical protein